MRVGSRAAWALALGALAFGPRAWGQTIVVGPRASSMSTVPGASLTVPVVADLTSSGGASLGSVAARLTWRAATLHYVSASLGTLGTPVVNADSAATGILRFAAANASGATGMPVLVNVTFQVAGAAGDTTTLGVAVNEITAAGSFANLLPATTTTTGKFCVSTGLWGDVDTSATLTSHDALILVTNAVGLPIVPYSLVNGDVDGNGVADTRDALIVLSYAVGLPTTSFRAGRLNTGSCTLRSAATVQIQPRAPSVAPGDSLPVTAVVRDSTGALVQGVNLAWASKDVTIVRAGPSGSLVAVAPGSTYATVAVQPGVKDSVPVVVTPVRHVWYVNPVVAAANLGVELGSQLYPFSMIDTAIVRAAPNDTVHVAGADYGPAHITKPLVLLGDSAAGGFPRLTSVNTPALRVDSVPGAVTIRRFRLLNSFKGLVAKLVQTLELDSVSVEGSRDLGIRVYGVDSLLLAHSAVVGAVGEGIELDSLRTIVLAHVRSDVIAAAERDSVAPTGLRIAQVNTVRGDSLLVATAGVRIDSAGSVTLRWLRVAGSQGPALLANVDSLSVVGGDFSGAMPFRGGMLSSWDPSSYAVSVNAGVGAIQLDSSRVHDNGLFGLDLTSVATISLRADTVARNSSADPGNATSYVYGFSWLRIARSAFWNNGLGYVDIEGSGSDSVTVDSTVFGGTDVYVYDVAAFRMHGGALRNGAVPALGLDYASLVELDSVEASGNGGTATYGGFAMPAVYVYSADTTIVNGINAHDNAGGALGSFYGGALRVNGGTMLNNGFGSFPYSIRAALFAYDVSDTRVYGLSLQDSADVGIAIWSTGSSSGRTLVDSSALEGAGTLILDAGNGYADTLIVSRTALTGFNGTSALGVYASDLVKLALTHNLIDSLALNGVQTYHVDTVYAAANAFRAWGDTALSTNGAVTTVDSNTFVGCVPNRAAVQVWAPGTTSLVGNTLTGCGGLVWVEGSDAPSGAPVTVLGNTLTRDTTTSFSAAVFLHNGLGYVQVAGNAVMGGRDDGIVVNGAGYQIDSARVDSNTVQQVAGDGIALDWIGSPVLLRYNLIADAGRGLWSGAPFAATFNTVVRSDSGGVSDNTSGPSSFRLGNVVGNVPYGMRTNAASMVADSNWWGGSNGPRCVAGCDTTSALTGDSILGNVLFALANSGGPVAGAPAIPAPPAAGIFRPLALRSLAAPAAPKAQGVRRAAQAPRTAVQSVPRPASRPGGRPIGHHRPAWMTEGSR